MGWCQLRGFLFLQRSPRSVRQNSLTPDSLWVTAAPLPLCLPGWRHPRGFLDVPGETVTAKQARDLKWEVSLAHGCLWNTAALTGVLKGSHRKFPRQAPKSWEITRAKGSCLKKNPIHCKAHLFYENKSTRVSKSSRNKIRWNKAQQLSFQNVAFKLLLYSLMHCYSQDWLQYNDLWLQKAACAWGLGLYLGTKSKVLTVK